MRLSSELLRCRHPNPNLVNGPTSSGATRVPCVDICNTEGLRPSPYFIASRSKRRRTWMSNDDLQAIYRYLGTLEPTRDRVTHRDAKRSGR